MNLFFIKYQALLKKLQVKKYISLFRKCVGVGGEAAVYLCSFVLHAGRVWSVGVSRPLASEVRPCDGVQGGRPSDGAGTAHL